ncbi:MAG TPA: PBP1A family penicillin-binding protein [Sphingomonadaceae bacterium]|nr:PBP1A family penicillin-binding protein [Sphingomonadaceae bacterium]
MASSAPPSASKRSFGRILWRLTKIGFYLAVLGLIALVIAVYVARASLPSFEEMKESPNGQMIRVRAADGTVLVSLGPSFGEWLQSAEIPPIMKKAMLSVEDKRFRSHPGVDPIGFARAVKVRWDTGEWRQGGSTITQQLARNIFLTNSKTFDRKLREALLALALERKFSKDQILELYLNRVYFGGGAYGIDAASRKFFGHSADDLGLSEAAIIAGLVKAPSNYSPTADAEAARDRAGVVIRLMRENGDISAAEAASADPAEIRLVPPPKQNSIRYFTDWALPQLDTLIEETQAPLDVWTTLDVPMQAAATQSILANTPQGAQGALVALDADGAVRAMVGGRDYVDSLYNRATQAQRQPGSAFKLFVYLAALEADYKPEDTVVDAPVTIAGWTPRNSTRGHSGSITLREAFARSVNTVAAKLGDEVGFDTVADMAQRFGITTPINTRPSMVLGSSDVRLIDMTRAFAAVSQQGTAVVPYAITKVARSGGGTGTGQVIYQHERTEPRVLVAPWVAAQMTDLLQSAVLTGTGRAAQIGRPVAGKTGTTSSNKDGWFLGFSSGITTGVWMGRDNAKPVPGLQGGTAPAQAFHDFMVKAVARRPVVPFTTKVTLPDWQLEPEEETLYGATEGGMLVDENGNPIYPDGGAPAYGEPPQTTVVTQTAPVGDVDQQWLDGVLGRDANRPRPAPERGVPLPPQRERQPLPDVAPPPEEVKFRPVPS